MHDRRAADCKLSLAAKRPRPIRDGRRGRHAGGFHHQATEATMGRILKSAIVVMALGFITGQIIVMRARR
jgi:hypothetical protein